MNRKLITQLGLLIRQRLYKYPDLFDKDLAGACAVASYYLNQKLRRFNIPSQFIRGTYNRFDHCWVDIGYQNIIDITATQFRIKDEVYFTTYKDNSAYLLKSVGFRQNEFWDWPSYQHPLSYDYKWSKIDLLPKKQEELKNANY